VSKVLTQALFKRPVRPTRQQPEPPRLIGVGVRRCPIPLEQGSDTGLEAWGCEGSWRRRASEEKSAIAGVVSPGDMDHTGGGLPEWLHRHGACPALYG